MPLLLKCDCGKALKVRDESAGKKVKCPGCGKVLAVPPADVEVAEADPPPAAEPPRRPARKGPPPRPAARGTGAAAGTSGRAVSILLSVVGLVALTGAALAVWWFFLRGGSGTARWEEFTSNEGHFQVLLPGRPTETTKVLPTPAGPVTQHVFAVEYPKFREAFVVGYADYPPDMARQGAGPILTAELELLVRSIKQPRTIGRKDPWEVRPGLTAAQVTIDTFNEGTIRVRALMTRQRLFTLMVRSPSEDRYEETAQKVYDSFTIVGAVPDLMQPVQEKEEPKVTPPRKPAGPFTGHDEPIIGLAFSARGDRLATVAGDGTLRLWEYPSGKEVAAANLRKDGRNPNSVAFARGGSLLAVGLGGPGERVLLWDGASRTVKAEAAAPGSAAYVAFSADDRLLIWTTPSACYRYAVPALGKAEEMGTGGVSVLSADGRRLFAASTNELVLFDLGAGMARRVVVNGPRFGGPIRSLAVSGDGRLLAVGSGEQVFLWDARRVVPLPGKQFKTGIPVDLALSPSGDVLAVRDPGGIRVYGVSAGIELSRLDGSDLGRMVFGPDGKLVIVHGRQLKMLGPVFGK